MEGLGPSSALLRGILAAGIGLLFSLISFSFTLNNYVSKIGSSKTIIKYVPNRPLPYKFAVDPSLLSPVLNQGDRGTCWEFQIIGQLEAQYKLQGYSKGYLSRNEYLRMSHEALGILMVQKCKLYPTDPICLNSPRGRNSTTGGNMDEFESFFNRWPDLRSSILPSSCCPYQILPTSEMSCTYLNECIKSNPLSFEIKNSFVTTNIRDAKQRIIETQLPLAISVTLPVQRYYFQCSNSLVSDSDECTHNTTYCPSNSSIFCASHDYKHYKITSTEMIFQETAKTVTGTPHALLFVGYNDKFHVKRPINYTLTPMTIGGFIAKNSWGARGHSIEYLYGNLTDDEEAAICPNKDDVFRWVPASFKCITNTYNSSEVCSNDSRIQRGSEIVRSADLLKCVNETHCNINNTYVLLRERDDSLQPSVEWSSEGVPLARVIEYNSSLSPRVVVIDTVPIQHLYYAFQLRNPPSDADGRCGYMFITYEAIEELLRMRIGPSPGHFSVQGLEVQWSEGSFSNSGKGGNYTMVLKSINKFSLLRPTSPTDTVF